jgi:hypothetical protein
MLFVQGCGTLQVSLPSARKLRESNDVSREMNGLCVSFALNTAYKRTMFGVRIISELCMDNVRVYGLCMDYDRLYGLCTGKHCFSIISTRKASHANLLAEKHLVNL